MDSIFAQAILAIDTGRLDELHQLLEAHADLVHTVGETRDGDYFSASTLLHHVAWNPYPSHRAHGLDTGDPSRMPRQMPQVVAALVAAGADPARRNGGDCDVVTLLMTGRLASEAKLTAPLLGALEEAGATIELSPAVAHSALANHSPEGARALLARGLPWDLRIAAGLGELDRLRSLAESNEPGAEELGLAAIHAHIGGYREVLDWILAQEPDLDVTGIQEGTLLHRACADGDLELIARLTELGADHNDRENSFRATPLDWADHAGRTEAALWILKHARGRLDLFQAAAHGDEALARGIVSEQPAAVEKCRDVWSYPAVQPLRVAVLRGHPEVARVLVEAGARVDHVGGDGRTAVDEARSRDDVEMIRLLS